MWPHRQTHVPSVAHVLFAHVWWSWVAACCLLKDGATATPVTDEVFDVTAFGARGDGVTVCTVAVEAAVLACRQSDARSKRVVFPASNKTATTTVFVVGPLDLSCNETMIDVQRGVVVRSVNTTLAWPLGPDCPEPAQGLTSHQAAPFVMVRDARNVTVTGGGTFDALGPMWWAEHCGNWWCPSWAHNSTPTNPYAWRPFMMRIMGSSDVSLIDITMLNCGFWCVVPTHSTRVVVDNVTIDTGGGGPNTDGIEPMWSTDVRVTNVNINNGDDCITVKSGSRDVFVENVRCRGSHGITIGSVWYDDVVNVTYRNITMIDCANGPRLKGRRQGNATISNIVFENVVLQGVDTGLAMDMVYETPGTHPNNTGVTAIDISFVNITGTVKQKPGDLQCLASRKCKGVAVVNVHITQLAADAKSTSWSCGGLQTPRWVNVAPTPGADCTSP
jgi:polygalacturonase